MKFFSILCVFCFLPRPGMFFSITVSARTTSNEDKNVSTKKYTYGNRPNNFLGHFSPLLKIRMFLGCLSCSNSCLLSNWQIKLSMYKCLIHMVFSTTVTTLHCISEKLTFLVYCSNKWLIKYINSFSVKCNVTTSQRNLATVGTTFKLYWLIY